MVSEMPVRRRYLISQLRRLRATAGYTQDQVWDAMGWSRDKIQRLEAGKFQRLKAADVIALCQLYGAGEKETGELVEIARQSRYHKPWWFQYTDVLPGAYIELEAEATMIQEFNISLIPGLLQTPDYLAGLMRRSEGITVSSEDLTSRIDMRLERQKAILERSSPPPIVSVIDEAALRRMVGGSEVMRQQMRHLCDLGSRPNIELQVLPFSAGAHSGGGFPFTILGFAGGVGTVVYIETFKDGVYLEDEEEITRHRLVFSRMQAAAMSVEESAVLLEQLSE